jgi:hypothetical protein
MNEYIDSTCASSEPLLQRQPRRDNPGSLDRVPTPSAQGYGAIGVGLATFQHNISEGSVYGTQLKSGT